MNIILANPALLPFLLLAGVPLLVHLFARARPPVYRFSSNAFIARLQRETARLRRPRSWLLLLLRTLLILALVAVFLQPVRFAIRNPASRFEARHVVVIVDATASMAYADGAQSRFAAACAEADAALAGLTARDRANIIWLRQPPAAVLPEPTGDTAYLREALRKARVSAGSGDPAAAFTLALAQITGAEGRREICLVSDFQSTAWEKFAPEVPTDVRLLRIPVAHSEAENTAVTRIAVEPPRPIVGEQSVVICELANFSPQPRRRTVFLEAGDIRRSADLLVPAWGTAIASIPCQFASPGSVALVATTEEDAFPVDNRRVAVVMVDAHARVVIDGEAKSTAEAWTRAINALGWAQATPPDALANPDARTDLMLVAGWNGSDPEAVMATLQVGTPVVVLPQPGLATGRLREIVTAIPAKAGTTNTSLPASKALVVPPSGGVTEEVLAVPQRVKVSAPDERLFELFRSEGIDTPVRGGFSRRLRLPPDDVPPALTLLAFADGLPALTRSPGLPLYLWLMPLAAEDAEWPRHAEFVMFMGELLRLHRRDRQDGLPVPGYPGDMLHFESARPLTTGGLELTHESGLAVGVSEQFREGVIRFASDTVEQPGLYTWRNGTDTVAMHAVNVPAVESDLRTSDPKQQQDARDTVIAGGAALRDLHEGRPLWPLLLAACLALALLEGLAAWGVEWK